MLIPFRSKACAEFLMLDHHVNALFDLTGKPFHPQGAVGWEQAQLWVQSLESALDEANLAQSAETSASTGGEPEPTVQVTSVSLKQRAWPLLDMLRKAAAKRVDVVWGSPV